MKGNASGSLLFRDPPIRRPTNQETHPCPPCLGREIVFGGKSVAYLKNIRIFAADKYNEV